MVGDEARTLGGLGVLWAALDETDATPEVGLLPPTIFSETDVETTVRVISDTENEVPLSQIPDAVAAGGTVRRKSALESIRYSEGEERRWSLYMRRKRIGGHGSEDAMGA